MRHNFCPLLLSAALLAGPLAAAKKVIQAPELAPKPGSPAPMFSPALLVDGTLYISGQVGTDIKSGEIPNDFDAEVKAALDRIGLILKAGGMTFADVVSVQVYLTDIGQFARMNSVYGTYFKEPRPTRTTVGVTKLALPNAHIEITVTARK